MHSPRDAEILSLRAASYTELQQWELCLTDCNLGILLEPRALEPRLRRAAAFRSLGRLQQAVEAYREVMGVWGVHTACIPALRSLRAHHTHVLCAWRTQPFLKTLNVSSVGGPNRKHMLLVQATGHFVDRIAVTSNSE